MSKRKIHSPQAPAPIGPYSQAIAFNNLFFASGQIAIDAETGEMMQSSIQQETHQVMKNIRSVMESEGLTMDNILKVTIFLANLDQFPSVNEVYATYLKEPYPARECVEVSKLPKGANVEISVIAYK